MPLAAEAGLNPWFSPSWVVDNWSIIMPLLGQHVRLTVVSVLIGALVAFPHGAARPAQQRCCPGRSSGLSTLVYTIPRLAMFAFVAPFTGLSETTVAIGLVLYSLVILVRNFLAGLQAVPADAREAARGMGYGSARLLWQVELPLALPSIFTGLRIATVSTVALVTVGVIVGQGGLGQIIIVNGFGANYYRPPIVFGTLACVLLALVADQLLALAAAAADAVGADRGGGMNAFGDAVAYLNDPLNWTRPRGHPRPDRPARADRRPRPADRAARRRADRHVARAHRRGGGRRRRAWSTSRRAVPTLAILAIFAVTPIGFTIWAPVIALTVFAIPPILANTYVGLPRGRPRRRRGGPRHGDERAAGGVPGGAAAGRAADDDRHPHRGRAGGGHRDARRAARRRDPGLDHPHRVRPAGQRRRRRRRPARGRAGRAHRGAARRRRPDRHPGQRQLPFRRRARPVDGAGACSGPRSRGPPAPGAERRSVTERTQPRHGIAFCGAERVQLCTAGFPARHACPGTWGRGTQKAEI